MARTALARTAKQALSKYDPDRGLKTIAAAEVAVKHYARAKDATKLQQAIRLKLEAQAEFVFWWDTHVEKSKGAAEPRRSRSGTALTAGENGLPERKTIHRWRQKLNDPDKFETTYERTVSLPNRTTGRPRRLNSSRRTRNLWASPGASRCSARARARCFAPVRCEVSGDDVS